MSLNCSCVNRNNTVSFNFRCVKLEIGFFHKDILSFRTDMEIEGAFYGKYVMEVLPFLFC